MTSPSLDPTLESQLKSTLWYQIGRLVDEETVHLGLNATPQYIGSLSELVWAQLVSVAGDVEAFARHRTATSARQQKAADDDTTRTCTVKVDDVLLLGRRNEGLMGVLLDEVATLTEAKEEAKAKAKGKSG
ncbi:hypothetical protein DV737_g2118, partial [Chaetothyriales sp. CBS 132003]